MKSELEKSSTIVVCNNPIFALFYKTYPLPPQICVDGLVGRTAADRDRGHDKKNTLPEAKKCYSSQCLEMCATVVAVSQLELLMEPVKRVR